ncbi:hypothetical protein [Kocuria marina]|uniref:hypothetical protein n=1 Tax=Kocuria marina TaxID=223184 RepID=UPI0022E0166F|nr:hypothetical protein [Kocuria marina]
MLSTINRDVSRFGVELHEYDSTADLVTSMASETGMYSIRHAAGVFTDVLFWNQHSDVTIVCFNGAGSSSNGVRPGYNGTSMFNTWKQAGKANFVFVHDATLYLDPKLNLAWYAGSENFPYPSELREILQYFITRNADSHVIFFGISGGGHAALHFSSMFPGSIAVAGNPQTDLDRYNDWAKNAYYRSCWADSEHPENLETNKFAFNLNARYAAGTDNFAYCLVNINDHHHVDEHLAPFVESASRMLNVRTLLRHWGIGHTAASPQFLLEFLDELVSRRRNGEVFPAVKGSRLLESIEDIRAITDYQDAPVTQKLFSGYLFYAPQILSRLKVPAVGTLELSAEVEFFGNDPVHAKAEFFLDKEPADRYIYGLRKTPRGYESTFVLRKDSVSMLRVFVPEEFSVLAIRVTLPQDKDIDLKQLSLTSYGPDRGEAVDTDSLDLGIQDARRGVEDPGPLEAQRVLESAPSVMSMPLDGLRNLRKEAFPVEHPTRLDVLTSHGRIPMLIVRREHADRTVIFSNGAVDLKRSGGTPVFQRSTWWKQIVGHQIFVCDPGTVGPNALGLSWGHVSKEYWAVRDISTAVRVLATLLDPCDAEDRVYFGSSGGGLMSIALCHFDPGSRAVVNNAQLDWTKWMPGAVNALRAARFDNLLPAEIRQRWPDTSSVLRLIGSSDNAPRIDYLVNLASRHDSAVELVEMRQFIAENPDRSSNIRIFTYRDKVAGHNPLRKELVVACLNGEITDVELPQN